MSVDTLRGVHWRGGDTRYHEPVYSRGGSAAVGGGAHESTYGWGPEHEQEQEWEEGYEWPPSRDRVNAEEGGSRGGAPSSKKSSRGKTKLKHKANDSKTRGGDWDPDDAGENHTGNSYAGENHTGNSSHAGEAVYPADGQYGDATAAAAASPSWAYQQAQSQFSNTVGVDMRYSMQTMPSSAAAAYPADWAADGSDLGDLSSLFAQAKAQVDEERQQGFSNMWGMASSTEPAKLYKVMAESNELNAKLSSTLAKEWSQKERETRGSATATRTHQRDHSASQHVSTVHQDSRASKTASTQELASRPKENRERRKNRGPIRTHGGAWRCPLSSCDRTASRKEDIEKHQRKYDHY